MVPPTIQSNLAGLRVRERILTFIWGVACVLSIVLVVLASSCLLDWLIDRSRDTPLLVRIGMLLIQISIAAAAGFVFIVWPQMRFLPDSKLALWVEDKMPQFGHRLISAVQLNEPDADLGGMSKELVGVVTREAETRAAQVGFAQLADHGRLKWSIAVAAPVVMLVLIPLAVWPTLSFTLLARQFLFPVDVPHSVTLVSASEEVWPIGEDIVIAYRVTGKWNEKMVGSVKVTPAGDKTDRYPLKFVRQDAQGAIFHAEVKPSYNDLTYSARLVDGRTKFSSVMKIVARPVILDNMAWIQIPAYCGTRPDGTRYEQPQPRGEVVGIPNSAVRIRVTTQKPITEAWLELRGPERFDPTKPDDDTPSPEVARDKPRKMLVGADAMSAELSFNLVPGLSGYTVKVKDEHGFDNSPPPRRSLRLIPEPPPMVTLLRDTFGTGGDFDLEGLPVPLGGRIRIPYRCDAPYGMSSARVLYRVLKKHESGNDPVEDEKWIPSPLFEVAAGPNDLPFDPKTGVFGNMTFEQQLPFHAAPSPIPEILLGRTLGGGRYFMKTEGLIDVKGPVQLKSGDQIEFCVEVFAMKGDRKEAVPSARSETRVSTVMDQKEFTAWIQNVGKEDERVKALELLQKGVFK